jgi:hypothetical protein
MKYLMKNLQPVGYFLFQKSPGPTVALKDMLQFMKASAPGKGAQFAHVEGETSLIPHLSLWENLHVVSGGHSWAELTGGLDQQLQPLIKLISNPHILSKDATAWERLTVSLIKATLMNTQHIMVDIHEDHHSQLNLLNFKKMLQYLAQNKNVYIAATNIELWIDEACCLVKREGYQFVIEELSDTRQKIPKTA